MSLHQSSIRPGQSESDTWSVQAGGGIGANGDPGTYTFTFTGKNSENASDTVDGGGSFTSLNSNTVTLTANGTGVLQDTNSYTLSASGSTTQNAMIVNTGADSSSGWTSTETDTGTLTDAYSLNDSSGDYTYSDNLGVAQSIQASWNDPQSGAGSFFASDSQSFNTLGASGQPWTMNGVPFAAFTSNPPLILPTTPPAVPVPLITPVVTPGDTYKNFLITQYNGGLITWPFLGPAPTTPLQARTVVPTLPYLVKGATSTPSPFLGRVAGLPRGYTGVVIIPYTTGFPGFVWQYYRYGWQVDYGLGQ